jgi:DNA-binding MarR family transcriptional regulator
MEDTGDWVATIVRRWSELRPELDPSPMLVIGRIGRLAVLLDAALRTPFASAGLANGDFDLLAALRRQGPPLEASPGELARAMLVTTGATTKRIDRLEQQGHVTRRTAESDARGRVVALTASGKRLTDRLMTRHLENERAILAALPADRRRLLADLLGELARAVEAGSAEAGGDRP